MPTRRQFLSATKRFLKGSAWLGAACAADGYAYERHFPVVETNVLKIRGLSEAWRGTRVVQLTDLHLEPFTTAEDIARAVELAKSLEPELVVVTGDFITKDCLPITQLAEILSDLRPPLGVYGVLGNHDQEHHADYIQRELERYGLGLLRNEGTVLMKGGQPLFLAGVDSVWAGKANFGKAVASLRTGMPLLFLVHEPDFFINALSTGLVSAQLSGHTHGGQIRCPGITPPPRLPAYGKHFAGGAYEINNSSLYVSRGIGCIGLPIRFAAAPEVTLHLLEPR